MGPLWRYIRVFVVVPRTMELTRKDKGGDGVLRGKIAYAVGGMSEGDIHSSLYINGVDLSSPPAHRQMK